MKSAPTIKEVAKLAGVSIGTVSRVINQVPSVRPATRQAVLDAMEQLGYKPNTSAQAVRRGETRTIGIIVRDISVTTLAELVQSAQEVLEPAGYTVVIACSYDEYEREVALLDKFAKQRVDGLLMTTCSETDPQLRGIRQSLGIPIVYFDRVVDGAAGAVLVDHRTSTRSATEYLLSIGHRRIALITGKEMWPFRERIAGYTEAFEKYGLPVQPELIKQRPSLGTGGYDLTLDALDLAPPPTALIAGGFNLLPDVLRAIRARKLRIPHDISVIAESDSDLAQLVTPAITAIRTHPVESGKLAAQILLAHMANRAGNDLNGRVHLVSSELILRESCQPLKSAGNRKR